VASFVSGIVTGCYYGLGPLYAKLMALDVLSISIVMAAGVLGGAVFLWPVGRLSDRVDRRVVILISMSGAIAACVLTFLLSVAYLPLLFFLFGGCVMPIYALSLAHAADNVDHSFLEVGTGILVMNAMGAIVGPTIAALFMEFFGAPAFFGFCGGILLLGVASVAVLIRQHAAQRPYFAPFEMATTAAAQGAVELDPRSDSKQEADDGAF
ncbi:MAG: MFS transporter, partial [Gammaproteobacteria bacterium]|nr:MFS transporter [Gammaproteobacteria bacterium]